MVTFNKAEITTNEKGETYLELELQTVFQDQKIIMRNTFPASTNFPPDAFLVNEKQDR